MMSIKDLIQKNIRVTHAIVVVFVWVAMEIMEQFDLYNPIPGENIVFFIVVLVALLLSKAQDHTNQNLLVTQNDKVEPTSEFDSLMRGLGKLLMQYQKFFVQATGYDEDALAQDAEEFAKDPKQHVSDEEFNDALKQAQKEKDERGTW